MRFLVLALGLAAVVLHSSSVNALENNGLDGSSQCVVSTVTVTETAPSVSALSTEEITTTVSTTITEPASTKTVFQTMTEVFSVSPFETTTSDNSNGPFFFTVSSSQTVWMGATPPSSMSFVFMTSTIEVYPTDTITAPDVSSSSSTDTTGVTTTLFSTLTSTEFKTVTAGSQSNSSGSATELTSISASQSTRGPYINSSALATTVTKSIANTLSSASPSSTWSLLSPNSSFQNTPTSLSLTVVPPPSTWSLLSFSSIISQRPSETTNRSTVSIHSIVSTSRTDNCSSETTSALTITPPIETSLAATDTTKPLSLSANLSVAYFSLKPTPTGTVETVNLFPSDFYHGSVHPSKRAIGDTVYVTEGGTVWSWVNHYSPTATTTEMSVTAAEHNSIESTPHSTTIVQHTTDDCPPTTTVSSSNASTVLPTVTVGSCPTGTKKGSFDIDFDDLPSYGEPNNKTIYPPILNPYNNLQWSQGWSYVPPPSDVFLPISGHQLGMFILNSSANVHSQNYTGPIPSTADVNGMFGAGANYADSAFWIDVFGGYFGCTGSLYDICMLTVNGWKYNETSGASELQMSNQFPVYACPDSTGCKLQLLHIEPYFTGLSAVQFVMSVGNGTEAQNLYVDNIEMAWYNNTCAAVQTRDSMFNPNK